MSFWDLSVSVTPPGGYLQPIPVTLGPSWEPNDIRMLFMAAAGAENDAAIQLVMQPNPPTGFTAAYSLNPTHETLGAFYRRLVTGDTVQNVALAKQNQWQYYMQGLLTARGVSPTNAPMAGLLGLSYTVGSAAATVASVAVPSAGVMVFFVGNVQDPEGGWPSWPSSMGCPTGWTNLVATDNSGVTYFAYDTNPAILVIGKVFTAAGSTGSVSIPLTQGSPAFLGMYMFLPAAADVSITLGAA